MSERVFANRGEDRNFWLIEGDAKDAQGCEAQYNNCVLMIRLYYF
jgi:hypothetical protein